MNKKVALITGASRGIGKAVAIDLAKQGYHVFLTARSKELLQTLEQQIGNATSYVLDVSDKDEVQACVNDVVERYQRIDVLFNNAGVATFGTSELDLNVLNKMIEVNLLGAIYVANRVAAQMKKQQSGYIFNVSSIAGKEHKTPIAPILGGYMASKFGLSGYSEALQEELLLHNVKVTAICPGPTATDMTKGHWVPQEEMLPVADIVKTVNYLLSLHANTAIKEVVVDCSYKIAAKAKFGVALVKG